jgi:hypothetical protein
MINVIGVSIINAKLTLPKQNINFVKAGQTIACKKTKSYLIVHCAKAISSIRSL